MLSKGRARSGTRGLFGVMEGGRSEDGGFTVCICSSIDGQGCHGVSLVKHGGGRKELEMFGDAVSTERYLQVERRSIDSTAE